MSMLMMVKAMSTKVGNSSRKMVLIKLADHANDKGICWPSHDHIAKHCEMSTRSVIRHIEALEKQGLIKVVKRKRNGESHNQSNLYFLCLYDTDNMSFSTLNDSDNLSIHSDNLSNDSDNLSKTIVTQCHSNQSLRTCHKREPVIEPIISDKSPNQKKAHQLPDDFVPNENHCMLAKKLGIHLDNEFEHFRDHHIAKGSTMKNWDAALNFWLRNAAKFAKTKQTYKTRSERNMELLKSPSEFKSPFDFDDDVVEHVINSE